MLTLLLVRHGTTEANRLKKYLGRGDSPLTKEGQNEAKAVSKKLISYKIDAIYTSPSLRTVQTIKDVAAHKGLEINKVEALSEIDFGRFESKTFKEVQREIPSEIEKMFEEGEAYTYPGGESLVDSYNRVKTWLESIIQTEKDKTLLICAHGGTLRNIVAYVLGDTSTLHWHFKMDHASLSIVTITEGFAVCEKLNDTSFLNPL